MILWAILICIALIVIGIHYWWTGSFLVPEGETSIFSGLKSEDLEKDFEIEIPTLHAQCHPNKSCGGDMTCDITCHRCKQSVDGDCASDVDCEAGLQCREWKCVSIPLEFTSIRRSESPDIPVLFESGESSRRISWQEPSFQV